MKQKVIVPIVKDCWCGAKACVIDWDFRDMYRVMCDNNHYLTKECSTINRAIHRWNNRVLERELSFVEVIDNRHKITKQARKDISDEMVVRAIHLLKETNSYHLFPYTLLSFCTGICEKVCYAAMERACERGYVECGVSLRSGRLTEKGFELLSRSSSDGAV